ncbi:MAG: succinate dehydrogenase iron-sulfur subunit [Oligoflexia bacterium]|nr:succinate dehydrogenase iron-sulfur subunit [Oligoflexia bacterium]
MSDNAGHSSNGHHAGSVGASSGSRKIRVKVRRQDGPDTLPYWQEFELPYAPGHNVLSVLMEIRKNPVDITGTPVEPVVWESNCLEEVCGACSMVINGRARQGCTALIDKLEQPIVLEPMNKFPVLRDLAVDRTRMFDNLKRVKAWVAIDGSYALGPGPKQDPAEALERYKMSTCMSCGVCLQVCPQVSVDNSFVGAAIINQVRLFNSHPTGAYQSGERLDALMGEGGIADCGNAQNCVQACPKKIPLSESIAEVGFDVTKRALRKFLGA